MGLSSHANNSFLAAVGSFLSWCEKNCYESIVFLQIILYKAVKKKQANWMGPTDAETEFKLFYPVSRFDW